MKINVVTIFPEFWFWQGGGDPPCIPPEELVVQPLER